MGVGGEEKKRKKKLITEVEKKKLVFSWRQKNNPFLGMTIIIMWQTVNL